MLSTTSTASELSKVAQYEGELATDDSRFARLCRRLELRAGEVLLLALLCEQERQPGFVRELSALLSPTSGRLLLGAVVEQFARHLPGFGVTSIVSSRLVKLGAIEIDGGNRPWVQRTLRVDPVLWSALTGASDEHPDALELTPTPLAWSHETEAQAQGRALEPGDVLVIRAPNVREALAGATAVAEVQGHRLVVFDNGRRPGALVPWLIVTHALPAVRLDSQPGAPVVLEPLDGWDGPLLALAGIDGAITSSRPTLSWRLAPLTPDDRLLLWAEWLEEDEALTAAALRHGPQRIESVAKHAHHLAKLDGRQRATAADVLTASQAPRASALGSLARFVPTRIDTDMLIVTGRVRESLSLLEARARRRERLADRLGRTMRARYDPGLIALFVGESGTGKTLAASWLATRLGLPLYRVDVASVVSKYIGETERNLAELLARAEQSDVVLLFDEADSMFGKRTDVRQATDRYANAQTNYLLQRFETYEGIVVLTSNDRGRLDEAFTRRIDSIIEFPRPSPEHRRRLWDVHLGEAADLDDGFLNRVAGVADLVGGHIRNVVLCAAVMAAESGEAIGPLHLVSALELEYRKLGRTLPTGIREFQS